MATLKDVAELAHVDISTVSRALNNSSYVHPDTKAKVMEAVKALSYQPNVLAKGLRQGKRNVIAVVIPMLSSSIFAEVVSGIDNEARNRGYATIIVNTGNDKKIEKESLNKLRTGFVDGMIIAGTGKNNRLIRDIHTDMPIVQVIRQFDPMISSVVVDYEEIGYNSVMYLFEKGCRFIGLINGSHEISPYAKRYAGYKKAVQKLGLPEIVFDKDSKLRGLKYGYECTLKLIDENMELDAVLAGTDAQGMGAIRALKENNLRIPEDVCVLSMTGHLMGDMLETSLTSMELPGFEIGRRSALMLIENIQGTEKESASKHVSFKASLEERESTAKL